MSNNGPFGFDPDDFDRVVREAGEVFATPSAMCSSSPANVAGWRRAIRSVGRRSRTPGTRNHRRDRRRVSGPSSSSATTASRPSNRCTPPRLDALRANKYNTDPKRKVRFLPYGIAVTVLDESDDESLDESE